MKNSYDAKEVYEESFNNKIEAFQGHKNYEWLRKYANDVLVAHTGDGYLAIKAVNFINKIIVMPETEIKNWLNNVKTTE